MTTRSHERDNPRNRADIVDAVTAAAAELFAQRGPTATSLQQIADRAGVNQGLVFRHIGTKDQVVAAVLDRLADEAGIAAVDAEPFDQWLRPEVRQHIQVIVRCVLDGYPVGELQSRFPGMAALLGRAASVYRDPRQAALMTAHSAALAVGWFVLEPFLRPASGLEDLPENDLIASIEEQVRRMLLGES